MRGEREGGWADTNKRPSRRKGGETACVNEGEQKQGPACTNEGGEGGRVGGC